MADLNLNIDMTKLKESYKCSGVWQEKGLALVPKKTRVDWCAARKMRLSRVVLYSTGPKEYGNVM
jgi:hypothetical protein